MNRQTEHQQRRFTNSDERTRAVSPGAIRVVEVQGESSRPTIELQMLSYFAVDSYGSLWTPGVLTAGIARRLPQLAWGHNWGEVIGRAVPGTYVDNEVGPRMQFYFDDFEDDPLARRVYGKVKTGTIDECSIGFGWDYIAREPSPEERERFPGVREVMLEAELDEVSLVLRGAVPQAKVLTVRSRHLGLRTPMMVDAEEAARVATEVKAGNMDLLTALQQIKEFSVPSAEVVVEPEEEIKTAETEVEGDATAATAAPVESAGDEQPESAVEDDENEATDPQTAAVVTEPAEDAPSDSPEPDEDPPVSAEDPAATVVEPQVTPLVETEEESPDEQEQEIQPPSVPEEPVVEPELQRIGLTDEEVAEFADIDAVLAEREVL